MSGIATGTRLGGYRLDQRLGTGAVGEVYRARDLKLERDVAIKVLRPELADDPERLRRFAREARAASALNHPSLVHIYDVGRDGGVPFLAMELVEGKTLRQLLLDGPLAEADLLELGAQLAEGLAKAHAGGIVHRDLKPENLMVSADGYLKILDFGLAKLWASDDRRTEVGAVLGTAAYMSPEQAGGGTVDFRSDIFSVGAILYEMATGRSAFAGGSVGETLAAVIRARPEPVARLAPEMPDQLGAVIARCLAKRPERRYDATQALARDLRALRDRARLTGTVDSDSYFAARSAGRRRLIAASLVASLVAAVVLALFFAQRAPRTPELARSLADGRLRLLAAAAAPDGRPRDPDLSPDGKQFVFVDEPGGRTDLFLGRVAGGARVRLSDDVAIESDPDFSPDGEHVAYTCLRPPRGEPDICAVPVLGGRVAVVIEGASMPSWSPDGRRLAFVLRRPGAPLALATAGVAGAARDGSPLRILLEGDGAYPFLYQPAWSPDGRRLAMRRSVGGVAGEIWLVPAAGGAPERLSQDPPGVFAHDPAWSADGSGVLVSSNRAGATNLWLLATDGGEPVRLTSGPGPDQLPSVAADGTVAFLSTLWRYSLRLHDLRDGGGRELLSHNSYLWAPAFSPDGGTLAFSRAEVDGAWHLWSMAVKTGAAADAGVRQLTDGAAGELYPRYRADGGLIFNTWSPPRRVLHLPAAGGAARTLDTGGPAAYADVSPDGRFLAFARQDAGEERIYVQPWAGGPARLLTPSPATLPRWSPDGRWIAFSPDRSVFRGVFVIAADGSGERRLTASGGWPVWWPDGERIGYLDLRKSGDQEVRTVPFAGGASAPVEGLRFVGTNHPFDVDPTGRYLAASDSAPVSSQIWLLEPAR